MFWCLFCVVIKSRVACSYENPNHFWFDLGLSVLSCTWKCELRITFRVFVLTPGCLSSVWRGLEGTKREPGIISPYQSTSVIPLYVLNAQNRKCIKHKKLTKSWLFRLTFVFQPFSELFVARWRGGRFSHKRAFKIRRHPLLPNWSEWHVYPSRWPTVLRWIIKLK